MLVCFGASWPFSIIKSLRSKSTKGKSLMFMMLIELGYVFGIIHKLLYSYNWVIWMYITLLIDAIIPKIRPVWYNTRHGGKNGNI